MGGRRRLPLAVAVALVVVSLAAGAGARPHPSEESDGPWKARVVEARTGAPIPDVVVVAWNLHELARLARGRHGRGRPLRDRGEPDQVAWPSVGERHPLPDVQGPAMASGASRARSCRAAPTSRWSRGG